MKLIDVDVELRLVIGSCVNDIVLSSMDELWLVENEIWVVVSISMEVATVLGSVVVEVELDRLVVIGVDISVLPRVSVSRK